MLRAVAILVAAVGTAGIAAGLPVFFVANRGQAPREVRYLSEGADLGTYFTRREIRLRAGATWLCIHFAGASGNAHPEGFQPLPTRVNYLVGSPRQWHRDLPAFAAVRYRGLYSGIDMVYSAEGPRLKSEFAVAPGADPARIRIYYTGAGPPSVQADGSLAITVGRARLVEGAPRIYQERDGLRIAVEGRYTIAADGAVGFALGGYDGARALIIDPPLAFSTLIGNSGFNAATAIALDAAGSAYIAGYTDTTSLPTASPAQNFNGGSVNVFVAKLNPSGNGLEYCTYMGGSNTDQAFGIAVDSAGAAYVTGTATSPNFPMVHAWQNSLKGSRNAFVFKLNPPGNMLEFSTYLGGSGADAAYGIAIDAAGNSYVVGDTTSSDFPANGLQTDYGGSQDAFVTKFSPDGRSLLFSTYLGGSGCDHGAALAVDSAGSVYLTGSTWSADFPLAHPFQAANGGYADAFLARLGADGGHLLFSTYLGGSGGQMGYPETGQGIALDAAGDAYVAGVTGSADFPLRNAIQPQLEGFTDVFVAKVDQSGSLLFSTYLGGSGVEIANGIALDAGGAAYVVGYTYSTDFPVTAGAIQTAANGGCDGFLFKLSPSGDVLLYATYLGGSHGDTVSAVAVDPAGNVYLAGWTLSANFPH